MRQPDIGKKAVELRRERNLTQEQLAEACRGSRRTIQRIEFGQAEPRAYTRTSLSDALGFELGPANTENEDFSVAALHLRSVVPIAFVPLSLWSWRQNESYRIDVQGRHVLNFQVTVSLLPLASLFLAAIVLPGLFLIADRWAPESVVLLTALASLTAVASVTIGVFSLYQGVANTGQALSGECARYALAIQFLKV